LEVCVVVPGGSDSVADAAAAAAGFVVDPDLVGADQEGKDVAEGGDQAAEGHVAVGVVEGFAVGVGIWISFVGQRQVFDESDALDVEHEGHDANLKDAPNAEQEAANAQLGPTNLETRHRLIEHLPNQLTMEEVTSIT